MSVFTTLEKAFQDRCFQHELEAFFSTETYDIHALNVSFISFFCRHITKTYRKKEVNFHEILILTMNAEKLPCLSEFMIEFLKACALSVCTVMTLIRITCFIQLHSFKYL